MFPTFPESFYGNIENVIGQLDSWKVGDFSKKIIYVGGDLYAVEGKLIAKKNTQKLKIDVYKYGLVVISFTMKEDITYIERIIFNHNSPVDYLDTNAIITALTVLARESLSTKP